MDFDYILIDQCEGKICSDVLYYQDEFQVLTIYPQYFWEHIWINDC